MKETATQIILNTKDTTKRKRKLFLVEAMMTEQSVVFVH